MRRLNVIIPLYNEAENIGTLLARLYDAFAVVTDVEFRFILVDDGSTDATASVLAGLAAADPGIQVVSLLRNRGHQHALMAGLAAARGDAALMMDGDGQHPPELAAHMIRLWLRSPGVDIVQGVRQGGQSVLKERTARVFYRLVSLLIPEVHLLPGAADFRLVTARVRAVMLSRPECRRNIRVFLSQYRFVSLTVPYVCDARLAGTSKYSLRKMMRLACDGIFAFTHFPLRLNLVIACVLMIFGVSFLMYTLLIKWMGESVSGWPSLVGLVCLLFSGVFAMLAVISEYIILIHEGVQDALSRPGSETATSTEDRGHPDL